MIVQPGLCQTWSETQICRYSHAQAQLKDKSCMITKESQLMHEDYRIVSLLVVS